MVYLVSFGIFILFVGCLAISLIFKRGGLKSESEAHELLEGLSCDACTNSSCGFQGQKRKRTKKCLSQADADDKDANIAFKQV